MAEYIERESVYNTLKAMYCDECTDEKCQMCEYAEIMFVLDNLPIADVQPVKRGYWKEEEPRVLKCSACGEYAPMNYLGQNCIDSSYCPWCGARMDGDAE